MSNQRKILHDDRNGLDYVLVGDYYLPVLSLPEETRPIGYWGMLRKEYMKNYKSGMYSYLLLTGKLDSYLADLYDPLTMPTELLKAHKANNRAVMHAYGFSIKMSEADCVAELMRMYQKLTKEK